MKMKKPLMMGTFCIVILGMLALTGCVQTEQNTVDGTLHNNTDDYAYVNFKNKATSDSFNWGVNANSTRSGTLTVGTYILKAYPGYSSDNNPIIDSAELVIQASDNDFTIIIYNTSLYAESY